MTNAARPVGQRLVPPPALFGRERERTLLRGALEDALAGHGRVLLVSGEAGIGKTTLVEDLAWQAAERGLPVFTGRCYDLSVTPPFGPWLEIIGQASGMATAAPVPTGEGGVVSAQVLEWLLNEAAQRPLMLILDDFHWADQASHDLLRLFARRVAELPVLLAVTYRSEEVQRRHPLYTLLPLLVRESGAGRIELRRLSDDAVAEWVAARYQLNGVDRARLVTFLQRNAEGNPFFVGELLRTMEDDELLALSAGGWRLRDLDDAEIPLLLRQVVEMRLGRLAEDDRRLVTVAAIIGQDVAFDTWAGLADAPEEAVYQAVEAAAEAGLMLPATGAIDRAHFNHALTRAALYDDLSPLERRRLHLRAADLLVADGGRNPDAIAFHLLQAGDRRAVDWQIEAGDHAWRAAARLAAAERYEAARELLETRGDDDGQLPWLYYRLAESYRLAQPQRALVYLEQAELLAQAGADEALVAWARWSRGLTLCLIDDPRGLEELLAGAQALDALPPAVQAGVWEPLSMSAGSHQGDLTAWLAALGRYDEAINQSDRYLEQVSSGPVALARTVADAHFGRGVAFTALGQPEPARVAFIEAMRRFQAQRHYYMTGVTAWEHLLMTLTYQTDQLAERRRIAEQAVAEWSRAADAMLALEPRLGRAPLLVIEGDWNEARAAAEAALRSDAWSVGPLTVLGPLDRMQGRPEAALAGIQRVLPDGPHSAPGKLLLTNLLSLQRLAAALAMDARELSLARAWIDAHAAALEWSGRVQGRVEGLLLSARLAALENRHADALAAAEAALAAAHAPRQPLALLASHRMLARLHLEAERYDAAGPQLDLAERLAEACAAPFEAALNRLVRAELLLATGGATQAREQLASARRIFEALDARHMLAFVAKLEQRQRARTSRESLPGGLTSREVEVLQLVAQGLTDAQVGEQLFISPRTVSQHLRTIYGKLNVSSRAAAVRWAVEVGLLE